MALIDVDWNPPESELRKFGGLYLPIFLGIVGALLHWKWSLQTAAHGCWIAAVVISALSFAKPPLARPLYVLLVGLTFPIGFVVSHLLMAVIFYLLITPIGLFMRLLGHDPMSRALDPDAETYWVPHAPPTSVDRYFRLY